MLCLAESHDTQFACSRPTSGERRLKFVPVVLKPQCRLLAHGGEDLLEAHAMQRVRTEYI